MKVGEILAIKGSILYTIAPGKKLSEAVHGILAVTRLNGYMSYMGNRRCGALVTV